MPELLVVVLVVDRERVRAVLGEVDRPGTAVREAVGPRGPDLLHDVPRLLHRLGAGGLSDRLLALAVAVDDGPGSAVLAQALGVELAEGWGLPTSLPVVRGSATRWSAEGAVVERDPLVAGAVVAAARAVGAHAHLPRP